MNLATLWFYSEVPGSWDQAASSAEHLRLCPSLYELRKTNSVDRKQSEANPVSCFPICLQGTITRCNKWVLLFLCKILPCVEELTSAHNVAPCVCIAAPQQVHSRSACPCSFLPCLFPYSVFSSSPPPSALSLLFSEDLL